MANPFETWHTIDRTPDEDHRCESSGAQSRHDWLRTCIPAAPTYILRISTDHCTKAVYKRLDLQLISQCDLLVQVVPFSIRTRGSSIHSFAFTHISCCFMEEKDRHTQTRTGTHQK